MARPLTIGPAASEIAALKTPPRSKPSSAADAASRAIPFERHLNDHQRTENSAIDNDRPVQNTQHADEDNASTGAASADSVNENTSSSDPQNDLADNTPSPTTVNGGSTPEPAGDPASQQALGPVLDAGSSGPQAAGLAPGLTPDALTTGAGDMNILDVAGAATAPGPAEPASPAIVNNPAVPAGPAGPAIPVVAAVAATAVAGSAPADQTARADAAVAATAVAGSAPADQTARADAAIAATAVAGSAPADQTARADATVAVGPAGHGPAVQGLLQNSVARRPAGLDPVQPSPALTSTPATPAKPAIEPGERFAGAAVEGTDTGEETGKTATGTNSETGPRPSLAAKLAAAGKAAEALPTDTKHTNIAQTAAARSDATLVLQPQNDGSPGFTLRVTGPGHAPQNLQLPAAAFAFQIARQVARGESRFEIRLDPPELGRIDVKLHISADGRVNAHLTVERSEALDLLQRDTRHLERALSDAGLKTDDGALSFSLQDQGARNGEAGSSSAITAANEETGDEIAATSQTVLSGHIRADSIDIRV